MTHQPSPCVASMPSEIIQVPFAIPRRVVCPYWALLQTLLEHGGHEVILDRIEPAPADGWLIHLSCRDPATITLMHDVAANGCSPGDPLELLLSYLTLPQPVLEFFERIFCCQNQIMWYDSFMTIRAAIYARTSPDCLLSADDQIERLKTIAGARGWMVAHVFSDRPTSTKAGSDRRPGEMAMIDTLRSGAIDRVLIWSIDRVGKSLADLVAFMETCRTACAAVYLDEQGVDSATSNGLALFDLAAMLAFHVRQSRRDRILRGQAAARSLSIRFGRPPIAKAKVEKARSALSAGKGV